MILKRMKRRHLRKDVIDVCARARALPGTTRHGRKTEMKLGKVRVECVHCSLRGGAELACALPQIDVVRDNVLDWPGLVGKERALCPVCERESFPPFLPAPPLALCGPRVGAPPRAASSLRAQAI